MDIVSRLKQFMEYTGMASSQFADTAQIPRPTLSQIMSGRNKKISNEIIGKLHEAFPHLNVIWLLFGDGDMLTADDKQISEPLNGNTLFDSIDYVPYGKEVGAPGDPYANSPYNGAEKSQTPPTPYPPFNRPAANRNIYHTGPTTDPQASQASQVSAATQTNTETSPQPQATIAPIIAAAEAADKTKHIASIMVFYTDSSFETFYPRTAQK